MNEQLNAEFWNSRYETDLTGWDLGMVSPPLKYWIDSIENKDKSILIPGAGNAYEVDYLLAQGFKDITVIDIAPILVTRLKDKYGNNPAVKIVLGDFFELNQQYDVVLEQTFFCAIDPELRLKYVEKMAEIIKPEGMLLGVLFDRYFEGGPPFGGCAAEYEALFGKFLKVDLKPCFCSHPARQGTEVLIRAMK